MQINSSELQHLITLILNMEIYLAFILYNYCYGWVYLNLYVDSGELRFYIFQSLYSYRLFFY